MIAAHCLSIAVCCHLFQWTDEVESIAIVNDGSGNDDITLMMLILKMIMIPVLLMVFF